MNLDEHKADVIIVGTGPGGATVAKELSQRGEKVLLLEWGKNAPITGSATQFWLQAGVPGKGFMFTHKMLGMVRGITTGGSSVFYYATAFDPPIEMFQSHGIDISNEVAEIRNELPTEPLVDHLIGPMSKRIMTSAKDLGYDWNPLPKFIYQDKCQPNCWRCTYGCPFSAKWNARMFVNEAIDNGAVLINGAKVTRVLTEDNQAIGVEYKKKGAIHQVYAPLVIIAAGGVGSPMILRNTGIKEAGYDWFFDPLIIAMGTVDDMEGGKEFPMAAGLHMADEGYVMTDLTAPLSLHIVFNGEVFRFDKLFSHQKTLSIMIKIKDDLGGKLSERGAVRKKLSADDKDKMSNGYTRASQILKNAGARDVWKSWYVAAHPGGTVKVDQLLDNNLKTEIGNLYVCDCSVIPEAWGLPPTFTILALGKRLAKHLSGELRDIDETGERTGPPLKIKH
ncbi:MAG: GMC family oxidoreductase N-terminal domain-containing protein [Thermodesulfobacteriota bacterium]|nr:GMC family oxidoreductase N-terminal domain-containing protein [Thermodesulfobacteriota bacterium]